MLTFCTSKEELGLSFSNCSFQVDIFPLVFLSQSQEPFELRSLQLQELDSLRSKRCDFVQAGMSQPQSSMSGCRDDLEKLPKSSMFNSKFKVHSDQFKVQCPPPQCSIQFNSNQFNVQFEPTLGRHK